MNRLTSNFSLIVLHTMILTTIILSYFYHMFAEESLIDGQRQVSLILTQSYANSIWANHAGFVQSAATLKRDKLESSEEIRIIRRDLRRLFRGLNVLNVTLLDVSGLVVYSTNTNQIGNQVFDNTQFRRARNGEAISMHTLHDTYETDRGELQARHIVTSYVPIRILDAAPVEGIIAIDVDTTHLMDDMQSKQIRTISWLILLMSMIYILMWLLTKRSDRLIQEQQLQREKDLEQMRYLAYHDSLTGFLNRASFTEHTEEAVRRAKRVGWTMAIMFLDLDRFKLINDSLGHDAGDQLLCLTAERIRDTLRESDILFRMGGDEFTILLEDLKIPQQTVEIAQRILDVIAKPIKLKKEEFMISASIGIAVFPRDGEFADYLVKCADTAMYRAKELGGSCFSFFSPEMNQRVENQLKMETALHRAVANSEFFLQYQPRVCARTQQIMGVEALLRWKHPEWGIMLPCRFISQLEETGLIISVGAWVIKEACRQNKSWQDMGLSPISISVNLSARQFRSGSLLDTVRTALSESGLDPSYLELELTESLLADNTENAIKLMHELKALGIALLIDDFGTGFSSLSYLKRFPIDSLKIDRSFVKDLAENTKDAAIIEAISTLANNLGLGLVGEGVENNNQSRLLRQYGCTKLQGYLFSHPSDADHVAEVIGRTSSTRIVAKET
jgi:diguanylate cyclase (GGDEF)-like protein